MRGIAKFYQVAKKVGIKETDELPEKAAVQIKDTWYIVDETMPIGLFRIGRYPDDKLFSIDQTLKYLEYHDHLISYSELPVDRETRLKLKDQSHKASQAILEEKSERDDQI